MAKTKEVKLKLDQLLRIKTDLENTIRKYENLMRRFNSRPKDEESQIDFAETARLYELCLDQLINVKEAVRDGNAELNTKSETNDRDIYVLSNLNRQRVFYESLNTFEGERFDIKSGRKNVEYKANITYKDSTAKLKAIENKIREVEARMSDFNHSIEVTVELYTELDLV